MTIKTRHIGADLLNEIISKEQGGCHPNKLPDVDASIYSDDDILRSQKRIDEIAAIPDEKINTSDIPEVGAAIFGGSIFHKMETAVKDGQYLLDDIYIMVCNENILNWNLVVTWHAGTKQWIDLENCIYRADEFTHWSRLSNPDDPLRRNEGKQ